MIVALILMLKFVNLQLASFSSNWLSVLVPRDSHLQWTGSVAC